MAYDDILRKYHHEQVADEELKAAEGQAEVAFRVAIETARPVIAEVLGETIDTLQKLGCKPKVEYKQDIAEARRQFRDHVQTASKSWFTLLLVPGASDHGVAMAHFPVHVVPVYETSTLHVFGLVAALGNRTEYHHYGSFDSARLTSPPETLRPEVEQMFRRIVESMRVLGPHL